MFLLDLIKNSGPDSGHFIDIYTNNARNVVGSSLMENWKKAYKSTVSSTSCYYPSIEICKQKYKKEILQINAEAHRFAIAFHRQKRSVIL